MSYFNYDPFFGNEEEENTKTENKNESEKALHESAEKSENSFSSFDDKTTFVPIVNDNANVETKKEENLNNLFDEKKPDNTDNQKPVETPFYSSTEQTPTNFFGEKQPDENNNGGNFNNYGGGNNGGNFNGGYVEKRKRGSVGLLLAILIPILIITNIFTCVFVFNKVWSDAKTEYDAKLQAVINQETNLTIDTTSLLAYNVTKSQLNNTVEISSTYSSGSSNGTGFVISTNGYIVTNAHVVLYKRTIRSGIGPSATTKTEVAVAEKVQINFVGSETLYNVTVVAYDADLDIAVCKMDTVPSNLTCVKFADSTLLQFGEPCVAIGNAEGYGLAVTEGVISSPIQYFNLSGKNGTTAAIQHSAAINPGNSGGPLFNMYGLVVGMNTFKLITNSDVGTDGMGFAIPSAVIKDYVNGLNIPGLTISYTAYNSNLSDNAGDQQAA